MDRIQRAFQDGDVGEGIVAAHSRRNRVQVQPVKGLAVAAMGQANPGQRHSPSPLADTQHQHLLPFFDLHPVKRDTDAATAHGLHDLPGNRIIVSRCCSWFCLSG